MTHTLVRWLMVLLIQQQRHLCSLLELLPRPQQKLLR
jgi:hypothetical protein